MSSTSFDVNGIHQSRNDSPKTPLNESNELMRRVSREDEEKCENVKKNEKELLQSLETMGDQHHESTGIYDHAAIVAAAAQAAASKIAANYNQRFMESCYPHPTPDPNQPSPMSDSTLSMDNITHLGAAAAVEIREGGVCPTNNPYYSYYQQNYGSYVADVTALAAAGYNHAHSSYYNTYQSSQNANTNTGNEGCWNEYSNTDATPDKSMFKQEECEMKDEFYGSNHALREESSVTRSNQFYPSSSVAPTVNPSSSVGCFTSTSTDGQILYHLTSQPPPISLTQGPNVVGPEGLESPPPVRRRPRGRKSTKNLQKNETNKNGDHIDNSSGQQQQQLTSVCLTPSFPPSIVGEEDAKIDQVFIWDLDETIILFLTLLTGAFAQKHGKDDRELRRLAHEMEAMIFDVADSSFFFNELEECEQVHIDDLIYEDTGQDLTNYDFVNDGFRSNSNSTNNNNNNNNCAPLKDSDSGYNISPEIRVGMDWTKKLALRFRKIKENYNLFRHNATPLLGTHKVDNWFSVRHAIEIHTDRWLSLAMQCLAMIQNRPNCINILVTQTQFVAAITKVLLFGLGPFFKIENFYSAAKIGKRACFEKVMSRFGGKKKRTFVVLGDGMEEKEAASTFNIPFWKISSHRDLAALNLAIEKQFI